MADPKSDNQGIVRHADNPSAYNRPDPEQAKKLGGSHVTVPAANRDGTSSGFNANEPDVIIVDPHLRDSFVVDLRNVGKREIREAMANEQEPRDILFKLGELSSLKSELASSRAVNPKSIRPKELEVPVSPPQSQPAAYPQPIPYPQPMQFHPQAFQPQAYTAPPQDPGVLAAISQLSEVVNGLATQVRVMQQQPQQAPVPVRHQVPASRPRIKVPELDELDEDEDEYEDEIKPAHKKVGSKQNHVVVFNYRGLGTMSAHYHDVLETATSVVLVFNPDDRASQYVPPESPDMIEVIIDQKDPVLVGSLGLMFRHGNFDYIVLVKGQQQEDSHREVERM